jgi:D-alanyl-D-alanine endopeptidase (penicillin-binding protein 7)
VSVTVTHASGTPAHAAGTPAHAAGSPAHSGPSRPTASKRGPDLKSNLALVIDESAGEPLYAKHPEQVAPIASITKLMTAMVVLDAALPLDEAIAIDPDDVDRVKHSKSRLPVGGRLARGELLRVALMSSDNRAAAALGRTYPGGSGSCVAAMNRKAAALGMSLSRFADPTGLSSDNVSTASDLARMVTAARRYPPIQEATTTAVHQVTLSNGRVLEFHNSNGLVSNRTWSIGLSKTGYINEAGRCLVMQATIAARQVIIVLLDSWGKNTRLGDAARIRRWMEAALHPAGTATRSAQPAALPLPPPLPPPDDTPSDVSTSAPGRATGERS